MLDIDTKRRIDTARDILVGKVPDPKSQVEQITIALIYKFMDDMDAESEELGGRRKFFADEFARYGWAKLMRSGLGGHEVLNLYAEAIVKMPENPGIPLLFRDIFKNAYLPYRDPETLRAFLKVIDEFEYDHSERLGDAFEYLLSVLGSQGDAGQFRTPRHIIDFMVEILGPKKNETILDPACGTAGFLISAYKHMLKANTDVKGHSTLTPDDRGRLARNFKGYDISPDMVRLSLVNMYLHGFTDPHIYEYDTLTNEDRWLEFADVILANPPFMSPKGGIRPHKRFSVQSSRSEVLFVDYMAEHLTPTGRAGIIVPEGIIFQSGTAYKQLRKMLVEDYLVAVVSLPAGVFQPYSGVKTSILILDKSLAKKAGTIAFFKVENDGFGLGAQRRPIDKNDLPTVQAEVNEYLGKLRAGELLDEFKPGRGHVIEKAKVAENGEYNLSVERYRETVVSIGTYPSRPLGEMLQIQSGYAFKSNLFSEESGFPIIRIRDIKPNRTVTKYAGDYDPAYVVNNGDLLVGMDGEFNSVLWAGGRALLNQRVCRLHSFTGCLKEYIALMLPAKLKEIEDSTYAVTVKHISAKQILAIEIPMPPLEVQQEIVAEIEGYQKVIDGARAVVEHYKPRIPLAPAWPMVPLGDVIALEYGKPLKAEERVEGEYPVYGSNGVVGYHNDYLVTGPAVIVGRKGSAGAVNYTTKSCYPIDTTFYVKVLDPEKLDLLFCYFQLLTLELGKVNTQAGVPGLNRNDAYLLHIPLPPLQEQMRIVTGVTEELNLVDSNRELISRLERKIQDTLSRVWTSRG